MNWIEKLIEQSDVSWSRTHNDLQEIIDSNMNPKLGVEIGVAFGSNSYKLLSKFNDLSLISIDPYKKYSEIDLMSKNVENKKGDQLYSFVMKRLNDKFDKRSKLIRDTSDYLTDNVEDESLDFIFIDGDHSYEGVKKDIQNSYNKVRKGGIISGDDYNGLFPSVNKAVDEFFNELNIKINFKNLVWWVVK